MQVVLWHCQFPCPPDSVICTGGMKCNDGGSGSSTVSPAGHAAVPMLRTMILTSSMPLLSACQRICLAMARSQEAVGSVGDGWGVAVGVGGSGVGELASTGVGVGSLGEAGCDGSVGVGGDGCWPCPVCGVSRPAGGRLAGVELAAARGWFGNGGVGEAGEGVPVAVVGVVDGAGTLGDDAGVAVTRDGTVGLAMTKNGDVGDVFCSADTVGVATTRARSVPWHAPSISILATRRTTVDGRCSMVPPFRATLLLEPAPWLAAVCSLCRFPDFPSLFRSDNSPVHGTG